MLKVALLTNNQIVKDATEFIFDQNKLNYKITETFENDTTLVIGDALQLSKITQRVMMIALMDSHDYDDILALNGLCDFIELDDIERDYYSKLNEWLDYYFVNYHHNVDFLTDYMLDEVLYFHFLSVAEVEVVLEKKTFKYAIEDANLFTQILPLNFISAGKNYIINIDFIDTIQENIVTMKDGKTFNDVVISHIEGRNIRKEIIQPKTISVGDYPDVEKIKKTRKTVLIGLLLLCVGMAFHITRVGVSYPVALLIMLLLTTPLYNILFVSTLQITGNFYQLRKDGIYFYECLSFNQKAKWVKAIENNTIEALMEKIPFDHIAYLRLVPRESRSMIAGRFMYLNFKNYFLRMIIETTTSSLEFVDVNMFGELIKAQIEGKITMASFVNTARLKNKEIQENADLAYVLNDPNATISQFLNNRNLKNK